MNNFQIDNSNFKIKLFTGGDIEDLEDDVNRFIKDVMVIDIKIASHRYSCTIMIIYI